jgi:AraC-like DNA-binding protein
MANHLDIYNGKKLYGELSDLAKINSHGQGYELYFKYPADMGLGYMHAIKLRPGLILVRGNHRPHKEFLVEYDNNYDPVVFTYGVIGTLTHSIADKNSRNDICYTKQGQCTITKVSNGKNLVKLQNHHQIMLIGLFIEPDLLGTILEEAYGYVPEVFDNLVNELTSDYLFRTGIDTSLVGRSVDQILSCPESCSMRRLFLEAKALEILALSIELVMDHERKATQKPPQLPKDYEPIIRAKSILYQNYENPPGLTELARMVGVNKNKLNQGFRKVFGTSAFEYLRMQRLERARQLLVNSHKSVTEIAFEVGYSQPSGFSKAFKRYFGANPVDLRAKS